MMQLLFGKQLTYSLSGAALVVEDERYGAAQIRELYDLLEEIMRRKTQNEWVEGLARLGVPCSPVNSIDQVFTDPQVRSRGMQIALPHPQSGKGDVDLIGNVPGNQGTVTQGQVK